METPDKSEEEGKLWQTITTAALTGLLAVMGTIGAAYLTGHFDLYKTETQNTGTIDLEKLKFANDLVKGALAAQNPANSLKFYADIGLLNSLNVEAVRQYAKNENERLKSGSSTDSVLPDFRGISHSKLWMDKNFFESLAPKATRNVVFPLTTTGNYILAGSESTATSIDWQTSLARSQKKPMDSRFLPSSAMTKPYPNDTQIGSATARRRVETAPNTKGVGFFR